MNLLSVPNKVFEERILPYLKWNDLLRFRRVSKATKAITQGFMKEHPDLAPEIEIGEDDAKRSFGAFLKMNIPTNRIFLNNLSGDDFYHKDGKNVAKFLKKCGPLVKHLRVKMFSIYYNKKEWDFLEALINLESFKVEYFGVGTKLKHAVTKQDPRFISKGIPNIFNQLKALKIGQEKDATIIANITNRTREYLEKGQVLEHVSLPFNSHFRSTFRFTLPEIHHPKHVMAIAFMMIDEAIQQRATKYPDKSNLKTFDFCCYHDELGYESGLLQAHGSGPFLELLGNCINNGVQLKNVGSFWFSECNAWSSRPELRSPNLGIPVLSLVNLNPCILHVDMPNLESVQIQATNRCSPGLQWRENRPDWPVLKSVDITSDCKQISASLYIKGKETEQYHQDAKVIFQFFFQDVRRINLTEIRLNFITKAGQVSVPKTDDIVSSCPNLKKITLINWPGTNKALIKLWGGLPALEEISLEYCKELGNVAFVGEDAKNPVFFKLKKLRKLSLKGLNLMPKITDTLFSLVLRHMNLTHLFLTSDCPLKSVTSAGILCLSEGKFSEKIEKFPFQNWSLEDVSAEEYQKMGTKFRSYNML